MFNTHTHTCVYQTYIYVCVCTGLSAWCKVHDDIIKSIMFYVMCSYMRFIWSDHYCCCYWFTLSYWICLRSDSVQLSGQQKDFLLRAQRSSVIGWEYFTVRWMARGSPACGRVHSTRGEGGLGWYLRFLRKKSKFSHIKLYLIIHIDIC